MNYKPPKDIRLWASLYILSLVTSVSLAGDTKFYTCVIAEHTFIPARHDVLTLCGPPYAPATCSVPAAGTLWEECLACPSSCGPVLCPSV